jgi:hypothetical protein
VKPLRRVLQTGATVFGLSALALIVAPGFFLRLLGLSTTPELVWSMVMIGITLVALTGMMAIVSAYAPDPGVVVGSWVMAVAALGLGTVTLLIPVSFTWFTLLYASVGFLFSVAYALGLIVHYRAR